MPAMAVISGLSFADVFGRPSPPVVFTPATSNRRNYRVEFFDSLANNRRSVSRSRVYAQPTVPDPPAGPSSDLSANIQIVQEFQKVIS